MSLHSWVLDSTSRFSTFSHNSSSWFDLLIQKYLSFLSHIFQSLSGVSLWCGMKYENGLFNHVSDFEKNLEIKWFIWNGWHQVMKWPHFWFSRQVLIFPHATLNKFSHNVQGFAAGILFTDMQAHSLKPSGGTDIIVWRIFGYSNIFEYFPPRIFVRIIFVTKFHIRHTMTDMQFNVTENQIRGFGDADGHCVAARHLHVSLFLNYWATILFYREKG